MDELIDELYSFRFVYNALLFNNWHKHNEVEVYKSRRHHDGTLPFQGEFFIVVAILPSGKQISNHYPSKYWDYFKIPSYPKVKDKFDGHTSKDVLDRLKEMMMTDKECEEIEQATFKHLIKCCWDDISLGMIDIGESFKNILKKIEDWEND